MNDWEQDKTPREIAQAILEMRPEPYNAANLKEVRRRIQHEKETREDELIEQGIYRTRGVFIGEQIGSVRLRSEDLAAKSEAVQNIRNTIKNRTFIPN